MQKTKRHILSTGPLPEALVHDAAARNIVLDVVPFIRTKPVVDMAIAARIQELFQNPITAVFTSTNAVMAVAALFQSPMPWKVYSIGHATAKTVTQLFQIPISGTADNGTDLAKVIIRDNTSEVFFFCGSMRHDALPALLRQANIPVHEIVVYETVETPLPVAQDYDAILFYSPSAAHSFFSINHPGPETLLFAIGNTTKAEVRQHTAHPVVTAPKPDKEALARLAIQHLSTKKEQTE